MGETTVTPFWGPSFSGAHPQDNRALHKREGGGEISAIVDNNYGLEVANPFWRVPSSILEDEIVLGCSIEKAGAPKEGVLWVFTTQDKQKRRGILPRARCCTVMEQRLALDFLH